MSNIISTETKSISVVKEARTYKLEIHSPKNEEYWGQLHHEVVELHDGEAKKHDVDNKKSPISFVISDILSRTDDLTYTDSQGQSQTIKSSDVPLIVQAFCDVLRDEAK